MPKQMPASSTSQSHPHSGDALWNVLTVLMVLAIVALGTLFFLIYRDPAVAFNPFPPPTMPAALVLPSLTPIHTDAPPTLPPTLTSTPTATATLTPQPTETRFPTLTPQPTIEVATPTKSKSGYPFVLQSSPVAISSAVFRPDTGCRWTGVAGQIFDLKGSPLIGLTVRIGGSFNGEAVDMVTLAGLQKAYGESGYEFTLSDSPRDTQQKLWLQMFDQSGIPLSERIYFDTFSDCQKNLILINFKQVR